jgi:hypothetical protein
MSTYDFKRLTRACVSKNTLDMNYEEVRAHTIFSQISLLAGFEGCPRGDMLIQASNSQCQHDFLAIDGLIVLLMLDAFELFYQAFLPKDMSCTHLSCWRLLRKRGVSAEARSRMKKILQDCSKKKKTSDGAS